MASIPGRLSGTDPAVATEPGTASASRSAGARAEPTARPDAARTEPRRPVPPVEPARRSRGLKWRRLLLLIPIVALMGALGLSAGYRYWYEATYFVITENAQVAGDLVQVGSLNAGRIVATRVEVGDWVQKDQELAVVAVPQQVGVSTFGGAPRVEFTGASDTLLPVRAPFSGLVAARVASVGSTVPVGQPIYTLIDPDQVWVRANVEETRVARLRSGQVVDVYAEALGRSFPGELVAIAPASTATFSLLPAQNASGNFVKITQLVPVKIMVQSGDAVLPLGTSVVVRIYVRQPDGGVPWQP